MSDWPNNLTYGKVIPQYSRAKSQGCKDYFQSTASLALYVEVGLRKKYPCGRSSQNAVKAATTLIGHLEVPSRTLLSIIQTFRFYAITIRYH